MTFRHVHSVDAVLLHAPDSVVKKTPESMGLLEVNIMQQRVIGWW